MTGPDAEYTLLQAQQPGYDLRAQRRASGQHQHEHAIRMAGLKAAAYLGALGKDVTPDEYQGPMGPAGVMSGKEKYPDLPASAMC